MPLMECVECGHMQTAGHPKFAACDKCGSTQLRNSMDSLETMGHR